MSAAGQHKAAVDRARQLLCREFAHMLQTGACSVRVRISGTDDRPLEAWFYAHDVEGWRKSEEVFSDPTLVRGLQESLALLASKEHADEWSARTRSTADWRDTDLHFHPAKLRSRSGRQLESTLMGMLFRGSHDSKKDARRSIRTPR